MRRNNDVTCYCVMSSDTRRHNSHARLEGVAQQFGFLPSTTPISGISLGIERISSADANRPGRRPSRIGISRKAGVSRAAAPPSFCNRNPLQGIHLEKLTPRPTPARRLGDAGPLRSCKRTIARAQPRPTMPIMRTIPGRGLPRVGLCRLCWKWMAEGRSNQEHRHNRQNRRAGLLLQLASPKKGRV